MKTTVVVEREKIVAAATSQGVQFVLECIQQGLGDYADPNNYSEAIKRDHSASVAASCINCHIIKRAAQKSMEMGGFIQIRKTRGRTTFILGDRVEIWYKKLNRDGKPSYRPSRQAQSYLEPLKQQSPLNLELPPEMERWVAGYRSISQTDTKFQIIVAGPTATGEWWEVPLSGSEIQELFPASAPASVPAATTKIVKQRVRIRKREEAENEAEIMDSEADA